MTFNAHIHVERQLQLSCCAISWRQLQVCMFFLNEQHLRKNSWHGTPPRHLYHLLGTSLVLQFPCLEYIVDLAVLAAGGGRQL